LGEFLADFPFFFATLAPCGARLAFFGGFGLSLCGRNRGGGRFFCNRNHVVSLGGDYRVTTWITPVRPESKRIVGELMEGDEEAMVPENIQMPSDALR
jgi:hypothetical protein